MGDTYSESHDFNFQGQIGLLYPSVYVKIILMGFAKLKIKKAKTFVIRE